MPNRLRRLFVAIAPIVLSSACAPHSDAIEPHGVAALGRDSAPTVLVFFTDYRCAACRTLTTSIVPALSLFVATGQLRIVVADLGDTRESGRIAVAARCAREFGKYWSFLDGLLANPRSMSGAAEQAGVPTRPFARCIESDRYARSIASDLNFAKVHGVARAPAVFLGPAEHPTRRSSNADELSAQAIESLVRRELASASANRSDSSR